MQILALKTFAGRYGLIRTGMVVTVDEKYGRDMIRLGCASRHAPQAVAREPEQNAALPGPERTAGGNADGAADAHTKSEQNSTLSQESGQTDNSEEGQPTDGQGRRSSSRRRAPRSRKKTSTTSRAKRD